MHKFQSERLPTPSRQIQTFTTPVVHALNNRKIWWQKPYLILIWLLISCYATAQTTDPFLEELKIRFITHVTMGMKAYKIRELIDKSADKKAFLQAALAGKYRPGNEIVEYKDLYIDEISEPERWHLGAIALVFSGDQPAEALFSKIKTDHNPAYFSDIKVKTQYLVLRRGATVIVVYSETSSAPKVASFFATLSTP